MNDYAEISISSQVELMEEFASQLTKNGFVASYKSGKNTCFKYFYRALEKISIDVNSQEEIKERSYAFDRNTPPDKEVLKNVFEGNIKRDDDVSIYQEAFSIIFNHLNFNRDLILSKENYKKLMPSTPLSLFKYEGYCNNRPPKS